MNNCEDCTPNTQHKRVRDLAIGDRVPLLPDGLAEITAIEPVPFIQAGDGVAHTVRWKVIEAGADADVGAKGAVTRGANAELHVVV